jgi:hypothetical protein
MSFDAKQGSLHPRDTLRDVMSQSRGKPGYRLLSNETRAWMRPLEPQLPEKFWIHHDDSSQRAAEMLGAAAFVQNDRIFVGNLHTHSLQQVLRHELVHLAQVQVALRGGYVATSNTVETEAELISGLSRAVPVQFGADPTQTHPLIWFVAIGVGAYVLLRPGVANAPGPGDPVYPSVSLGQVFGEAICIFVVPGGAMALGGRLGLGFLGKSALAGASANVGLRAVGDIAQGQASSPLMYLYDASTGAVIGFIVPGGVRLIGQVGTQSIDRLATYGLSKSDIAITKILAQQASIAPLNAAQAQQVLMSRGVFGQASQWWLNRRGTILLYRGQDIATQQILSPLARQQGVAASEALVARMRAMGMADNEIAGYTARWHTQPVPPFAAPPGLASQPLGAVGIPTTRLPGIAAQFGDDGVIYMIRVPKDAAISPNGWQGLQLESEYVILNQIPHGSIIKTIPAGRIAPLTVNEQGLLAPGR